MESFRWDESFLTGIPEVDAQHRRLVGLINNLDDLLVHRSDDSAAAVDAVSRELTEYTRYHFEAEESFMAQIGVDPRHVGPHRAAHQRFIAELAQMGEAVGKAKLDACEKILRFLTHWLAHHILGTDQAMARQIVAIGSGRSAADAFVAEETDRASSTGPLLRALDGLFQQVSSRNHELTELNRTLELRVEARTKKLQEANALLEAIAMTDILTGLPNRRHALSGFEREWKAAAEAGSFIGCMMIDADGFKQVNDTCGHEAGDDVLRQLARALKHAVRTDDIVARLGGDEFLIICPHTDLDGSLRVAEHVRASVASMRVVTGGAEWSGSISVGVSARHAAMTTTRDLMKAADDGVYLAKKAGRNCVRTADRLESM